MSTAAHPPTPPPLDDNTVRELAAYFEANARNMLADIQSSQTGPLMVDLSDTIFAVANLTTALALREEYDVDRDMYG